MVETLTTNFCARPRITISCLSPPRGQTSDLKNAHVWDVQARSPAGPVCKSAAEERLRKHVFVLVHNGIVLGLLWWLNSLLGVSLSPRWDALLLLMVHLLVAWAGQGRVGPRATLVGWNLTKLVLGAEELHTSAMLCMALATACGRAAAAWFLRQVAWWLLAPMLRTRAECYMPATRPLHARYTPAICMAR